MESKLKILLSIQEKDAAFDKMVETVQKTTETAITETGEAYAESKSELRNFIDAVRPIALYVAIASVFYFIFKRSK